MTATKIVRWILTAALMSEVWNHAHWSVALALILLSIATELESQTLIAAIR